MKNISKEELELMSYDDIAYIILKENNKKMKIQPLFTKVCKVLGLNEKTFEEHIASFFEILSTDKRFVMLEKGYWDLKDNHPQKIVIDEESDDEIDIIVEEESEPDIASEESDDEEDIFYDTDDNDDQEEDDLQDLVVLDEEELEELN